MNDEGLNVTLSEEEELPGEKVESTQRPSSATNARHSRDPAPKTEGTQSAVAKNEITLALAAVKTTN